MPYLMQIDDDGTMPQGWELEKNITVFGRGEDADVQIKDDTMSRKHFAIECKDGDYKVTDLESVNGIRHNNSKVKTGILAPGDIIEAGCSKFSYDIGMSTMINQAQDESGRDIKSELKDIYKQFE